MKPCWIHFSNHVIKLKDMTYIRIHLIALFFIWCCGCCCDCCGCCCDCWGCCCDCCCCCSLASSELPKKVQPNIALSLLGAPSTSNRTLIFWFPMFSLKYSPSSHVKLYLEMHRLFSPPCLHVLNSSLSMVSFPRYQVSSSDKTRVYFNFNRY